MELKCIPFVESLPPLGMEQLDAADVMSKSMITCSEIESARSIWSKLAGCKHNGFPVVNAESKCVGMILRVQLIVMMRKAAWSTAAGEPTASGAAKGLTYDDFLCTLQSQTPPLDQEVLGVTDADLDQQHLDLRPVMNPHPLTVHEATPLARVYRLYRALAVRHLPVVNVDNVVLGMISRKELRTEWKGDSLI